MEARLKLVLLLHYHQQKSSGHLGLTHHRLRWDSSMRLLLILLVLVFLVIFLWRKICSVEKNELFLLLLSMMFMLYLKFCIWFLSLFKYVKEFDIGFIFTLCFAAREMGCCEFRSERISDMGCALVKIVTRERELTEKRKAMNGDIRGLNIHTDICFLSWLKVWDYSRGIHPKRRRRIAMEIRLDCEDQSLR